ncbi:carbohydrate ABC transporter permease [Poriferisphaera sp. WC338]|uniref:carbohydrate ABC transporter permease n=1 Tax=Poriferisphaera sp. WC338 TaxID=3425129 RepID=UPI003D814653
MTKRERQQFLLGTCFISPWLIGVVVFMLYPVCMSLYYAFCDFNVLSDPTWIGTTNFTDMARDSVFWKSLYNTFYYAIFSIPLSLILALLVAIMLNQKIMGRSVFRAIYFLPSIVPLIAVAMIWIWLFNGKYGLINYALSFIGIEGPQWLSDPVWTKPTLILVSMWQIGGTVVIFLAALQEVPQTLYESAELDGAGPITRLIHITAPLISPVIYFNLIMGIIGALQVFVTPFVMLGGGGPNRSALFYSVYLYQNAFSYWRMGYASAMAWILFILIASLTILVTLLSRKHVFYAGD